MKSFLAQVLLGAAVILSVSGYPSYSQDGRFFYQVPLQATHGHLLASLTPQQQQFVQHADPFNQQQQYLQQPYYQVAGLAPQDAKKRPAVGQQQLLGQQLLGQHQVLYFSGKDGAAEEQGGAGAGSTGGYVDSFLGLLGSYWPGQTASPDNTVQPVKPPGNEENAAAGVAAPAAGSVAAAASETKPEKQEKETPVAPAPAPEASNKYYMAPPALRAPQRHPAYPQHTQFADIHREMLDGGLNVKPGSGAVSFHKMLAAARLKAAQAGAQAAFAEQEAQSVSAEEAKEETGDKESSEQESYGPSIAQAKPQAVSVAGRGGVAAAAPVGTAVVGPGGMALSAPHATAVAGAPRKPQHQEDKLTRTYNRHQANIPPASYFLRY